MKKIIFRNIAGDCVKFFILSIFTISLIIWVLQAVNYLDFVIEDGHGFMVYFKYTLLSFPKILSRIYPYAVFLSFTYILLKYENNNELVIFWNFGIYKIKFINFFIKISFAFALLNLILNSIIAPLSQDKARSFIRTSDLAFFESVLKPKKFIDIVKDLTIFFDEKTDNGDLKNIFMKDNIGQNDFKITFAKKGVIELRGERRLMVLYEGRTINHKEGKISEFEFSKTDFDIGRFDSTTTTSTKTQENSTKELIQCLLILKKIENVKKNFAKTYVFNNCKLSNIKNIYKELYKRLIKPFYNILLVMIALLLILKSKDDHNFSKHIFKIYTFGFLFIIFLETSSKFISSNFIDNLFLLVFPIILFFLFYSYFLINLGVKKK